MTEPREPEPVPEGESVQPEPAAEAPKPDTGNWYPVDAPQPEAAPEEPVTEPEPLVEPAEPEPVADQPVVPVETESVEPEPVEVPADRPVEPVETSVADAPEPEPEPAPEPEADQDETVQLRTREPAEEPTVAVEPEATTVQPRTAAPVEPIPPVAAPTDSIFRAPSPSQSPEPEPTRAEQLSEEEQKLAAERAARREARAAALAATAPVPVEAPEPVIVHKRTNDKFWGSLGLFLLRLVVAAIFAIRGLNLLTDIPAAQAFFAETIIPEPGIMAIVTGVACLLIAFSLVLGLLTRVAGLGIALIAGGALTFVYWGNWSPFVEGRPGFLGEFELLLAAVGLLFLMIGAGGWSLDRSFRAARARDKAERSAADE